jgi:hypothetical protein
METAVIPVSDNADRRRRPHRPGAAPGGHAHPHPGVGRHRRGRAGGRCWWPWPSRCAAATTRCCSANLSEKDGAVVIAKLDQLGVDYKFADGGGSILVPASRVYELRMKLSAAGVNKGSITGYELLDGSSSFGQSDGQQRVQLKRALEGELTRTIQSLAVGAGGARDAGDAAGRTASSASSRSPPRR